MADLKAMTSGLLSKSMGTGAGGGIPTCSVCWVWVKVGRLSPGRVVAGSGGVIGETGGRVGDGGSF